MMVHLPFRPGCKLILRPLSVLRIADVLDFHKALLLASEFPTFYERFSWCVNFSSFGSMKKTPRKSLALSSFGFLDSPFLLCLAFRCIRHMLPHIWPYSVRVLRLSVSLVSLSPDHVYPSSWPFVQQNESCEACPCI